MEYFLYRAGKQIGPLSVDEIAAGLASGKYSQSDHVWHEGLSQSKMLSEVFQAQPQALPPADVTQPVGKAGISAKIRQAISVFAQGQGKDTASRPNNDEPSEQSKPLNETSSFHGQMPPATDQAKSKSGIPPTVMQTIRRLAQQEYPDDYTMQRYIIEQQCESFSAIQVFPTSGIPGNVYAKIREKAVSEYPDDYSMQKYTIEQQVDAYRQLHSG